jgi:WD40 repeat protein
MNGIALSPDGRRLAVACGRLFETRQPGVVRLWHLAPGGKAGPEEGPDLSGHKVNVMAVAFSPDGKTLASATGNYEERQEVAGDVILWDAATGKPKGGFRGQPTGGVWSLAFSADSRTLAVGGKDKVVTVWDVSAEPARELPSLRGHQGCINSVAFSPVDPSLLASGSADGTVYLWDLADRNKDRGPLVVGGEISRVAFSAVGKRLAAATNMWGPRPYPTPRLMLWELPGARPWGNPVLYEGWNFQCLAFAPGGKQLLAAHQDGKLRLWDVAKRPNTEPQTVLEAYGENCYDLALSPEGRLLVTLGGVGKDNGVKLWRANPE